ncbi:hypothetical protein [uncultured Lacinutrix sp.]|uniref:hypothetical protein n=1 Tax=uncultured Lacinutrix sp. TaxID=574032 RepID=UPI00261C53F9|nr:hypothetical protein [uncultured Lacinutrix sp.]
MAAQSKQIDVVHLNNGSILKGVITEMIVNESLTVEMDNGSIIKIKMSDVKKVIKETSEKLENNKNIAVKTTEEDDDEIIEEVEEEIKSKKKKGKFWKALGNIAVATLNKTAENVKNKDSNEESTDLEEYDEIEEEEIESETNSNVGSICFLNPNYYSRKIVLTNRTNGKQQTILVGKANHGKNTNSCAYDISIGIYTCQVFTTFSKKMIEQYNIRISSDEETSKKLTRNHYN